MQVPFNDLKTQYNSIKEEIKEAMNSVLDSCSYVNGKAILDFEKNFLNFHPAKFASGCTNGTSAITVSLRALGVGPGDEVITVANTFIATVEAIHEVGAKPILIDCQKDSYNMQADDIQKSITDKTKAIIAVHLYGNPCNIKKVSRIAKENKLFLIEDSAQAHLATCAGQAIGTFGDTATFSFYPGKNLGAYADAGMIISSCEKLSNKIKMHIDHGRTSKYTHEFLAGNYRISSLQAAVLDVKLKYINAWTNRRIEIAQLYNHSFKENEFKLIQVEKENKCVYHLYVVEVSNRDEVMSYLNKNNIACGIHYPIALHLQPALKHLNYDKGSFPNTETSAERIISLPIYPDMTNEQVHFVIEHFLEIAKK